MTQLHKNRKETSVTNWWQFWTIKNWKSEELRRIVRRGSVSVVMNFHRKFQFTFQMHDFKDPSNCRECHDTWSFFHDIFRRFLRLCFCTLEWDSQLHKLLPESMSLLLMLELLRSGSGSSDLFFPFLPPPFPFAPLGLAWDKRLHKLEKNLVVSTFPSSLELIWKLEEQFWLSLRCDLWVKGLHN